MKRRAHPRVQMLHGARLAKQHEREFAAIKSPEDLDFVLDLHAQETRHLSHYESRAYVRTIMSPQHRSLQRWMAGRDG